VSLLAWWARHDDDASIGRGGGGGSGGGERGGLVELSGECAADAAPRGLRPKLRPAEGVGGNRDSNCPCAVLTEAKAGSRVRIKRDHLARARCAGSEELDILRGPPRQRPILAVCNQQLRCEDVVRVDAGGEQRGDERLHVSQQPMRKIGWVLCELWVGRGLDAERPCWCGGLVWWRRASQGGGPECGWTH